MAESRDDRGESAWDQIDAPASLHVERPKGRRDTGNSGALILITILLLELALGGAVVVWKASRGLNSSDQVIGLVLITGLWVAVWNGARWAQWLFAGLCLLSALLGISLGLRLDAPLIIGLGAFYALVGICMLLHPGVNRFLRLQRGERG
jgi:hypothetical protein